jgi:uncharacterized protein
MPLYPRFLKPQLKKDLQLYPVVAVMGARQVGKSTICRQIAAELGMAFRTLDDRDIREQAVQDPEGLLDDLGSNGAVLDEVQRAPELLLALKAIVDREHRNGRYLLSGSNQPKVSHAVAESLQGRAAYRTLRPLTLSEQRYDEEHHGWQFLFGASDDVVLRTLVQRAEASGAPDWHDIATTGGFPRVLDTQPVDRLRVLDDYIQTYTRRDVREVIGIESVDRFESFLRLVGARTAQELNVSGLSSELGIPVSTIRRWVDALERSYLAERIPPYSRNAGKRILRAPMLFIADVALALAAAREQEPTGFHLETLVATDLCAWRDGAPERGLYHWRIASGPEVDFVLQQGMRLLPVEVKSAVHVELGDARHLRRFRTDYPNTPRGLLISCSPDIRALADGIIAAPWWAVL